MSLDFGNVGKPGGFNRRDLTSNFHKEVATRAAESADTRGFVQKVKDYFTPASGSNPDRSRLLMTSLCKPSRTNNDADDLTNAIGARTYTASQAARARSEFMSSAPAQYQQLFNA